MTGYSTDEERLEALRTWWGENGRSIIIGVVLGVAILAGWKFWTTYQQRQQESASQLYGTLLNDLGNKQADAADKVYAQLKSGYERTPYAALAALHMAKLAADANDLDKAAAILTWANEHASEPQVREVARIRLARVLVAQKKYDEAMKRLDGDFPNAYLPLVAELKGDIYRARGQLKEAHTAYQQAMVAAGGHASEYLQMKLADVGTSDTPQPEKP
ncbi:MAG: tetratricopeptide repeat protein [Gammaproteobacteria bacterium]|jgi:predicted negative regulator of RcsB-dependent stress response